MVSGSWPFEVNRECCSVNYQKFLRYETICILYCDGWLTPFI